MRRLILCLGLVLVPAFAPGAVGVAPFSEICRHADIVALVRVEGQASRKTWFVRVTQNIHGTLRTTKGTLDRFHFDPRPSGEFAVVSLPADSTLNLAIGFTYLVFLKQPPSGNEYPLVDGGYGSFFAVSGDHIEGLPSDADDGRQMPGPIKKAIERIAKALAEPAEGKNHP